MENLLVFAYKKEQFHNSGLSPSVCFGIQVMVWIEPLRIQFVHIYNYLDTCSPECPQGMGQSQLQCLRNRGLAGNNTFLVLSAQILQLRAVIGGNGSFLSLSPEQLFQLQRTLRGVLDFRKQPFVTLEKYRE